MCRVLPSLLNVVPQDVGCFFVDVVIFNLSQTFRVVFCSFSANYDRFIRVWRQYLIRTMHIRKYDIGIRQRLYRNTVPILTADTSYLSYRSCDVRTGQCSTYRYHYMHQISPPVVNIPLNTMTAGAYVRAARPCRTTALRYWPRLRRGVSRCRDTAAGGCVRWAPGEASERCVI